MPIRPHLDDHKFDPETIRVMGLAYEMARVALRLSDCGDLANEVLAHKSAIRRERPDAMIAFTESFTLAFRQKIGEFALANRLPMAAELREFAVVGGLASYGTSRADLWRRSASYVVKILRGANPGDMPVEQPTRVQLSINTKTAAVLGISIPDALLGRADKVIE